jgi:hypothetical protein
VIATSPSPSKREALRGRGEVGISPMLCALETHDATQTLSNRRRLLAKTRQLLTGTAHFLVNLPQLFTSYPTSYPPLQSTDHTLHLPPADRSWPTIHLYQTVYLYQTTSFIGAIFRKSVFLLNFRELPQISPMRAQRAPVPP